MADIQLDKNSNAKKLARDCNEQGLVRCHRLPVALSDEDDDVILRHAKSSGRILLTYDRSIITDFWHVVIDGCPGVVILAQDDDGKFVKFMTYRAATRILAEFKRDFPQWHSACWDNSIVEIKPSCIEVNHVGETGVQKTGPGVLARGDATWQETLQVLLQTNASRC
jgi:hypothetical protein